MPSAQYRHYLKAFDWKKKVGDISRVRIQNHLKPYKDYPYAYFHGLTSLKGFFNWCVRQEIIDKNPIAGERIVRTPARERVLSPEEIQSTGYPTSPRTQIWRWKSVKNSARNCANRLSNALGGLGFVPLIGLPR